MGTTNLDALDVASLEADAITIGGVAVPAANLDTLKYLTASYTEINNVCDMTDRVYSITGTPTALSSVDDRSVIVLNKANGQAITLPAATGSGIILDIIVGTTITSVGTTIKVTGNDIMKGFAVLGLDGGDTCSFFATAADTDTITMDGSTTGGIAGARVKLVDIAADTWFVEMFSDASGSEATPFSATVA